MVSSPAAGASVRPNIYDRYPIINGNNTDSGLNGENGLFDLDGFLGDILSDMNLVTIIGVVVATVVLLIVIGLALLLFRWFCMQEHSWETPEHQRRGSLAFVDAEGDDKKEGEKGEKEGGGDTKANADANTYGNWASREGRHPVEYRLPSAGAITTLRPGPDGGHGRREWIPTDEGEEVEGRRRNGWRHTFRELVADNCHPTRYLYVLHSMMVIPVELHLTDPRENAELRADTQRWRHAKARRRRLQFLLESTTAYPDTKPKGKRKAGSPTSGRSGGAAGSSPGHNVLQPSSAPYTNVASPSSPMSTSSNAMPTVRPNAPTPPPPRKGDVADGVRRRTGTKKGSRTGDGYGASSSNAARGGRGSRKSPSSTVAGQRLSLAPTATGMPSLSDPTYGTGLRRESVGGAHVHNRWAEDGDGDGCKTPGNSPVDSMASSQASSEESEYETD